LQPAAESTSAVPSPSLIDHDYAVSSPECRASSSMSRPDSSLGRPSSSLSHVSNISGSLSVSMSDVSACEVSEIFYFLNNTQFMRDWYYYYSFFFRILVKVNPVLLSCLVQFLQHLGAHVMKCLKRLVVLTVKMLCALN
jgi:hypothetical protein